MSVNYKQRAARFWAATPAGTAWGEGAEPGTKAYFDQVRTRRSTLEVPWLYDLVPFASFSGRKVLELGCGAGYDAYEFCRHGADYTGIDLAPGNPGRTRTHLGFYGYAPKVLQGDAENLGFPDRSFEVVFSNGVLHHTPDIGQGFREAHRVLKPGGVFYVIVYHQNSLVYWLNLLLWEHLLKLGFLQRSFSERLSRVECGHGNERPLVRVFSRRSLKKLLEGNGFTVESLEVRKLVHEDLPAFFRLRNLYRRLPQAWLDRLGRLVGWYVIARATRS